MLPFVFILLVKICVTQALVNTSLLEYYNVGYLPEKLSFTAIVCDEKDFIYIIGGNSIDFTSYIHKYNRISQEVETVGEFSNTVEKGGVAFDRNRNFYYIGGHDRAAGVDLNTIYILNLTHPIPKEIVRLPYPISNAGVVSDGGSYIYIVGGLITMPEGKYGEKTIASNIIYKFIPSNNKVKYFATMPQHISHPFTVWINGFIWIFYRNKNYEVASIKFNPILKTFDKRIIKTKLRLESAVNVGTDVWITGPSSTGEFVIVKLDTINWKLEMFNIVYAEGLKKQVIRLGVVFDRISSLLYLIGGESEHGDKSDEINVFQLDVQ